jgi:hypothetical protein
MHHFIEKSSWGVARRICLAISLSYASGLNWFSRRRQEHYTLAAKGF